MDIKLLDIAFSFDAALFLRFKQSGRKVEQRFGYRATFLFIAIEKFFSWPRSEAAIFHPRL